MGLDQRFAAAGNGVQMTTGVVRADMVFLTLGDLLAARNSRYAGKLGGGNRDDVDAAILDVLSNETRW